MYLLLLCWGKVQILEGVDPFINRRSRAKSNVGWRLIFRHHAREKENEKERKSECDSIVDLAKLVFIYRHVLVLNLLTKKVNTCFSEKIRLLSCGKFWVTEFIIILCQHGAVNKFKNIKWSNRLLWFTWGRQNSLDLRNTKGLQETCSEMASG